MTDTTDQRQPVLGLDVGCDSVALFDGATGRTTTIANTPACLHDALAPFAGHRLAVCEATGGHEDAVLAVLHALAIPAVRADAAKVKAYIRSFGKRAKTDAIDARWPARYAHERGDTLERWQPPAAAQAQIAALVARRLDLVAIKTQETNRLKAPRGHLVADDICTHLDDLARRIAALEARIADLVARTPDLARRQAALRSVPGIGPVLAPCCSPPCPNSAPSTGARPPASPAAPRTQGTAARTPPTDASPADDA